MLFTGCTSHKSAERQQSADLKQAQNEMQRQVGMPNIVNFQEKKWAKMILEMRDRAISTYTYTIDMNGNKHFFCNSVGYGLPYSVQYINPMKRVANRWGAVAIPQAEPMGLFMPSESSATWILCSDKDGGVKPVYVEPQIIVSPFKLGGAK